MPSFVDQYKTIFLGVVSHKFVLKSSKILNRIFWVTEYLFKDLECKIWSTNTKPFFWKSETKLQTLEKLSPYIGVSYKFAFKTLNTLNRILWPLEYWFRALECKFFRQIKNYVFGRARQTWYSPKTFSYIGVSNLLSDWIFVQGFRMQNLVNEYKTIFLEKRDKASNSRETFSLYWSFLKICFQDSQHPKSNLLAYGILVQVLRMPNLVDEYKSIFLRKRDKLWHSSKSFSLYWRSP